MSDSRAQGVISLKSKTQLTNAKMKAVKEDLSKIRNDFNAHSKSISDLRSRVGNAEKDIKNTDKLRNSYASVVKANQSHCSTQTLEENVLTTTVGSN